MIQLFMRYLWPTFFLLLACWAGGAQMARADVLAEYLFWDSMGNAAGSAVKNYNDYKTQRQLWQEKIAEGEARLKACGNCAERGKLEKELSYWKNTENKFQDFAGQAFLAVGMPRNVAKALGINMPMAMSSSAEIRERNKVVRPSWADDRPEFCQQPVDEYIGCLRAYKARHNTLFTGRAKDPGGECYDLRKLVRYCGAENYQAFDAEVELQKKRAAGSIIPEYLDYANEVYYGEVKDDFVPSIPADVVLKKLQEIEKRPEVRFSLRKKKAGLLTVMAVKPFRPSEIAPYHSCMDVMERPQTEIAQRECDDLHMMSWNFKTPVLHCQYTEEDLNPQSYLDAITFWYVDPPQYAEAKHLLSRSTNHPVLAVGEQRTDCPATRKEAEALQAQWLAKVNRLRAKTPQTAEEIDLPKPEWLEKLLADANKRNKEQYEAAQQRKKATEAFPFEGVYTMESTLDGETTRSSCLMFPSRVAKKDISFLLRCEFPGGESVMRARLFGGYLQVTGEIGGKGFALNYQADESDPNVLAGSGPHNKPAAGRLVRVDGLAPLADFPVEGVYSYERSVAGVTEGGQCTVALYRRHQPPPFIFQCTSDNGDSFTSTARDRENTLHISWSALEGHSMGGLIMIVADENVNSQEGVLSLVGWNNYGGRVRIDRTGDLSPEPEPVSRKARIEAAAKLRQEAALKRQQEALERRQKAMTAKRKRAAAQPETEEKAEPGRRCTPEEVAGTYRTGFGRLVCTPAEGGLECCYSNKCRKKAQLAFDETGRNMDGTWQDSRNSGPVIFPVSSKCELETGKWNYAGKEDNRVWGTWSVTRREP